jgi:hypothetical protein
MAPMTPPIVVSSDERPPIKLRRSETQQTFEDEVREISQARMRLDPDDETGSRDIHFSQSRLEDLTSCIDDETERGKLAQYLPDKIAFEARNQCFDFIRQGQDGDAAFVDALQKLESPLGEGLDQWRLAKVDCHLQLGNIGEARVLLNEKEPCKPIHKRIVSKVAGIAEAVSELAGTRGTKRPYRGESQHLSAGQRPAPRRGSTLNTDAEYQKMLHLDLVRRTLDLALRAGEWEQVSKSQIELHGIDPGYFDIKEPMERFDKIRQLLNIGQMNEGEAKRHANDRVKKRHHLEEALRSYNHGCYTTELFHQHFDVPYAQIYDYDHIDCANLFFSAARVCIFFREEDFKSGRGRSITPKDLKLEPTLVEHSWAQQALYFLEQGRSRALLDNIVRGEEFVPRLQRRLLDRAVDSVVWAAQASVKIKKRDSLFPDSAPSSPPSQAVSPTDSPPEGFKLFHAETTRSSSPSPAFRQAMEVNKRRSTFDHSTERPNMLDSEPSSPILSARSARGSFTDEQMKRLRISMRWRRVKLYLFSEINPTFNAAVAALPNAGKARFRELSTPMPEGIVVIEYGLPSCSPGGLVTLVITAKGVEKALWCGLDSKRIRSIIRALRRMMHDDYTPVRRDAVSTSPISPTSFRSVSDIGDSTIEDLRRELYGYLVEPIEVFLRSVVPERVIVVPSGELAHVPWGFLLMDYPFSIVPSLSIWHRLHRRSMSVVEQPPNVSVFSNKPKDDDGVSRDIPFSRIEALYLSWLHEKLPNLADDLDRKTFEEKFSRSLGILHLCAHSNFDDGDPLNSAVQLFREPWSITQWHDLAIKAHIVIFSSCLSAISQAYDSGSTFGFAHTLLATGTKAFIGSLWPVDDEATLLLMMLFYDALRRPLPPDEALYEVS